MKLRLWFVLLSVSLAAAALRAADVPAPAADPVEAEWAALFALTHPTPPPNMTGAENYRWYDSVCRQIGTEAFAFMERHPADPRRWRAAFLLQTRRFSPRFVLSIGDDYATAGEAAVVRDKAAEAAWEVRVAAVEQALRAATDVPPDIGEQLDFGDMWTGVLMPAYQAAQEEKKIPDWAKIDAAVTAFLARWPASDTTGLISFYVSLKKVSGETDELAVLQAFVDSPNAAARDYVTARQRFHELGKRPLEMAFTAVDGREVDLAKLRGKVVLIDFWATWCGPCKDEIPNVVANYKKYHDRGFEIVSISLDKAEDRQKLIDYTKEHDMPWPQHFDGKFWKNKYAVEYTITGVPAMFLLDQAGMLVSTDARGPKLEAELKRLLKL